MAQTTSLDDSVNQKLKALFQPALQLNDSDVQLLRRFDNTTLIKFVTTVQQLILNKNFGQGINATSNSYTQTIYSNSYSTKTPYCNQQTNICSSDPNFLKSSGSNQAGAAPSSQSSNIPPKSNYYNNPTGDFGNKYPDDGVSKYFPGPINNPNMDNGGYDVSMQALRPEDMKDLPQMGAGGQDCTNNYGVDGNMSGTTARLKFDVARMCKAFGKRLKVVDAKRACNGPSRHCFGEAIDFTVRDYGDRKQQAMLVISLISIGYNIGSYTLNFPLHADHENSSKWKTWSGVEHTNYQGSNARPYDIAVRDALSIIGMPAISSSEFRAKYGNPSKPEMSEKARAVLGSFVPSS